MDAVATMTLGETVKWSIGILLSLSAIIQISPIKINPWSYAAKIIGRAINSEMIEKIDKFVTETPAAPSFPSAGVGIVTVAIEPSFKVNLILLPSTATLEKPAATLLA